MCYSYKVHKHPRFSAYMCEVSGRVIASFKVKLTLCFFVYRNAGSCTQMESLLLMN